MFELQLHFADNFNILKEKIEELYSEFEFDSIKETISNFKNDEIEFITKNRRYEHLFQNKLIKQTLIGHNSGVVALTTLSNGDLVSGSDDNTIKIWNGNDFFFIFFQ